jgi:hypothetical protein
MMGLLLALALLDVRPLTTAQVCAVRWGLDHQNRLHRAVCLGTIPLADAQQQMRTWQ